MKEEEKKISGEFEIVAEDGFSSKSLSDVLEIEKKCLFLLKTKNERGNKERGGWGEKGEKRMFSWMSPKLEVRESLDSKKL